MIDLITVITGSLLIFIAERVAMALTMRRPAGREWIRRHPLLHPNSISYMRMPMGLVTIAMWHAGWPVAAFLWFALWMITDLTDGTIARSCDLISESGKVIDPLSDKLLYWPVLIYLSLAHHLLPAGWIAALVSIDAVGQLSRCFVSKTAANSFGKSKTALITIAIVAAGLHLVHPLPCVDQHLLYVLTMCATVLAFLSFYAKVASAAWYAHTFIAVNALSATMALVSALLGYPLDAFIWLFLKPFLELFDDHIRDRKTVHRTAARVDDVSDGIKFGGVAAILIIVAVDAAVTAFLSTAFYGVCAMVRLRRLYRVGSDRPGIPGGGLPPALGSLLAGGSALLLGPVTGTLAGSLAAFALIAGAGLAMVAPIHFSDSARRMWLRTPTTIRVSLCLTIIVFFSLLYNI